MTEENPLAELEHEPTDKVLVEGEETEAIEEEVKAPEETEEVKVEEKTRAEKRQRLNNRDRDLNTKYRESERSGKEKDKRIAELMERNRIKEKPVPDNYADTESYQKDEKAYTDQEIEAEVTSRIETRDKDSRQKEANDAMNQQRNVYTANREKAIKADPKFVEYENSVGDAIKAFDAYEIHTAVLKGDGIELVKYFGQNPDVLEDISLMSASDRMYELGKIANKVKAKAPKTISSAPKPTREVKLSANRPAIKASSRVYDSKKESWTEYCKRRNNR